MRQFSPLLFAVVALLASPRVAGGQDFPPPEQAASLSHGEPPSPVGPILSAGLGWGGATSIGSTTGVDYASQFKAGKSIHGLAGIRLHAAGLAVIYRQGTPGVANKACPGGGCDGSATQKGALVMIMPNSSDPGARISLGVGGWVDSTEIKQAGALVQRLEGWAFVEYMAVEVPIGPPTSRFRAGGYFIFTINNYTKQVTPSGTTKIPTTSDTLIGGEIGVSVSFF